MIDINEVKNKIYSKCILTSGCTHVLDFVVEQLNDLDQRIEALEQANVLCTQPVPRVEYPIFKRNRKGEVIKFTDEHTYSFALTGYDISSLGINKSATSDASKFMLLADWQEIPYNATKQLYHLQPVWCWGKSTSIRSLSFYDCKSDKVCNLHNMSIIESVPIRQLGSISFIWDLYQEILKEQQ